MNPRYERAARILYWLVPPVWCLALYWQGLFTWFQADDFAWLNLQVHSWNDLWKALFTPQAQGTVRIWSERLFFIVFKSLFGFHPAPFRIMGIPHPNRQPVPDRTNHVPSDRIAFRRAVRLDSMDLQ